MRTPLIMKQEQTNCGRLQSDSFTTMNLSISQSMLMGIWHGMVVQFPAISSQSNGKFSSFVGVRDCRLDTWGRFLGFPDDPGKGGSWWEQGLLDVAIYQRMVSIQKSKEALDLNVANFQTVCRPQMQVLRFCDTDGKRKKLHFVGCFRGSLTHLSGPPLEPC